MITARGGGSACSVLRQTVLDGEGVSFVQPVRHFVLALQAVALQAPRSPREAGVAVGVALSEEGDLLRPQPHLPDQDVDHRARLLRVAGAVVDDVAVGGRLAQDPGAGERAEEGGSRFVCDGNGGHGRGRAHVPDHGDDRLLVDEPVHVGRRLRGLVLIVQRDQAQRTAVDATGAVCLLERGEHTGAHVLAELRGGAAQRRRHAHDDRIRRRVLGRRGGAEAEQDGRDRARQRADGALRRALPAIRNSSWAQYNRQCSLRETRREAPIWANPGLGHG